MKNHGSFLLSLFALVALSSGSPAYGEGVPRLVVNILVDGLRSDYMEAFAPLYGDDGLRRLLKEGRVYEQATLPMASADRASAAATLSTGALPADHGIIALRWLDRNSLLPVACTADGQQGYSASRLATTTVGDELKVASGGRSLVYSIAPWPDTAILTAGHAADAALWLDDSAGGWTTTSYYGALPAWAMAYNAAGERLTADLSNLEWRPSNQLVGEFSYFLSGGMRKPFCHKFKGEGAWEDFRRSGLVNDEIAALAETAVQQTMLGADAVPDLLNVTFYAGAFRGKSASMEVQDTYVRLDRAIARLLQAVESKMGRENALFVVSSTGTSDEEAVNLENYRIPTGTFDLTRAVSLLNMYLAVLYGSGQYVDGAFDGQIYLNHKAIEDKQLALGEVLDRSADFLLGLSGIKEVYTSRRLLQGAWTPEIGNVRGGYHTARSGDILLQVAPGWHYVHAEHRIDRLQREAYLPFPIIIYGMQVAPAIVGETVTTDYIAPTLSAAMRIRAPNAASRAPLRLQ